MKLVLSILLLSILGCKGDQKKEDPQNLVKNFYPAGEKEKIFDESKKIVSITSNDPEMFRKPSTNSLELYRVILSSDFYKLRQIRQTENITRKPDPEGDALIMEDLQRFNKVPKDIVDDGVVKVHLNPKTGRLEKVEFDLVPRIGDFAKIIQNDATRWVLEHKVDENFPVTKFTIAYNIYIFSKASREDIKEQLKKEVRK